MARNPHTPRYGYFRNGVQHISQFVELPANHPIALAYGNVLTRCDTIEAWQTYIQKHGLNPHPDAWFSPNVWLHVRRTWLMPDRYNFTFPDAFIGHDGAYDDGDTD